MVTARDTNSDAEFIKTNALRYLKRFGREYTLIHYTSTRKQTGRLKANSTTSTTIWGDLQYNFVPGVYGRKGIEITGDGMFFTVPDYTISLNDEIVHPNGTRWKLVEQIEEENVGTGKPYIGFKTVKKAVLSNPENVQS